MYCRKKKLNKNKILNGDSMKADKDKLKKATKFDLMEEIDLIDKELSNVMYPPSWARTKELLEYKDELKTELKTR